MFNKLKLFAVLLLSVLSLAWPSRADNVNWYNGSSTTWTNKNNWTNSANANILPGAADNAVFNSGFTGSPITINSNPATVVQLGSLTFGSAAVTALQIKPQSTGPAVTTLNLNGVGGILLSNNSANFSMALTRTNSVNQTAFMALSLGASGIIYANNGAGTPIPGTAGSIELNLPIGETGGSRGITLTGPGRVYLRGTNTYTGSTIISNGVLQVDDVGTIGNGSGTLYFSGGNLQTSSSSTTRFLANPVVVNSAGNSYIYSTTGTASTRVLAFSGSLTGVSGTLVLGNPSATIGSIFDVEMQGAFSFSQPLVVGDNLGDSWSDNYPSQYSELQLANSTATGSQIFTGNISGDGPIYRGSAPGVTVSGANGVTIFTGSNSYSGGTFINNGTLYANNSTGSALGTGSVVVTNTGVLGGNGFVTAPVVVFAGSTVQPGVTNTSVGNLSLNGGLTFNPGANYTVQISSAAGNPGGAWNLLTCGGGWTDAGNGATLININLTATGPVANWTNTLAYTWMILTNNGSSPGFNAANWTVNTTGFTANNTIAGTFSVSTDANGDLLLNYNPTSGNIIINVPSGSVAQGGVTPTNYPVLTGLNSVTKVGDGEVILTNSLNSYLGTSYILAGTASAAVNSTTSGGAFGASTSPLVLGNTNGTTNATLNISQPNVLVANAVTVQAGSSGTKTIGTTVISGVVTNSGNVTLNDSVTLSAASGGSDVFLGNFSGGGGITTAGGGTITLAGLGNYTGPTVLNGGTLNLNAKALGTNTITISQPTTLDNTSSGSVTLNSAPMNWNADFNFAGSTNLNLGAGAVTMNANRILTVSNAVLTVGGSISGPASLTKAGAGQLSLNATNAYTGGTTNLAGVISVNASGTFGDGTGPLVLAGGNLLDSSTRASAPINNPVILKANARIYGNSTDTSSPNRYLPFTGAFTFMGGSTLYIDNLGSATTIFNLSLQGTNYTTINWPVVIGDSGFDTAGALTALNLLNDNTTPVQTISSVVTGSGSIIRAASNLNAGGTTILTAQNTFSGGVQLTSGTLGIGGSSTVSGGAVVSGPLGTGQLTLGSTSINGETNVTIFASSGPVQIDNHIFLNGYTNFTFAGVNNLLFTGDVNSGGIAKTLTVTNGLTVTFSGAFTNTGGSSGGALIKAGGGTLVLGGNSTYVGTTTVSAGTLLVSGSLFTNAVTAKNGGTLGGKGSLGGNLTFNTGAQAYLFKSAGSPNSPLTVVSNLTLNANAVTVDLGGTTTLGAGTYTLLTYGGTLSGAFNPTPTFVNGTLAGGNIATIDVSTPNQVNLVVAAGSYTPPSFPAGAIGAVSGGNVSLVATGAIGATYRLWATTNLALTPVTNTWTLLNSGTVTASPFTNLDLTATNYPQRFYQFTTP
jgi:fibronectin-binding autotransporter adhesin